MTMEGTGIVPVMDMNNRNYGDCDCLRFSVVWK